MPTTATRPALNADTLYLGDNGRMFCGELRCAGSSAHFAGRTIAGQDVLPIGADEVAELRSVGCEPRCEACGKTAG